MKRTTGRYITTSTIGEEVKAFIPFKLPPEPPLAISSDLQRKIDMALLSVGRLDSVTTLLPDPSLFLYMYVRKEAVLSSLIEGTQSSLSDLLLFEIEEMPGVPLDDVKEVSNYVAALTHGIKRLHEGFPLCNRLLREIHSVLLESGRGSAKNPGEFRRSQNWIGGTRPGNARYIPPPPTEVQDCMTALEGFYNNTNYQTSVIVKAALAHVQFETIHPFLDGNGRLGRLLITLIFCTENILHEPLLYLSLYFKSHREEYYALLQRVRIEGDWEAWLDFFTEAVIFSARQAVDTASSLVKLSNTDRERIGKLKRVAGTVLQVHGTLIEHPLITIPKVCEKTGLHPATVQSAFDELQRMEIVREITGKKRNRIFAYDKYIVILNEGTQPPNS